ncbi:hypothetical protein MUK42_37571 [Musa troglodytarum]|uniref:Uncharacterized protein n=1 Tax=Musa troglodytarum TaxID=320322 RepID=A0A9E7HAU6_9LILI|nr:hypothetical protein MUK42_37571 [Musa troglodytarum]
MPDEKKMTRRSQSRDHLLPLESIFHEATDKQANKCLGNLSRHHHQKLAEIPNVLRLDYDVSKYNNI